MFYEIEYEYEGKTYSIVEQPYPRCRKDEFFQQVLSRIESLTLAGAKITEVVQIIKR